MTIKKQGQLWEQCEKCGCEPVYMPLNLCDRCWPVGQCEISTINNNEEHKNQRDEDWSYLQKIRGTGL